MNVDRYLARIGVLHSGPPSLGFLTTLQRRHLYAVPFENLSVTRGEPIVLEEARLYDKIVVRGRGGFCYELNGLFAWLLRQLGFRVSLVSALVFDAGKGRFGPAFDHMALLVELERPYLVDVGFGDSARRPLALPQSATRDVSGHYRLAPAASGARKIELQKQVDDGWQPQYVFATTAHRLSDFAAMCRFQESSPLSPFTQRTICTLATPTGRISLSADALTVTDGLGKHKRPITADADFAKLLSRYFGAAFVA